MNIKFYLSTVHLAVATALNSQRIRNEWSISLAHVEFDATWHLAELLLNENGRAIMKRRNIRRSCICITLKIASSNRKISGTLSHSHCKVNLYWHQASYVRYAPISLRFFAFRNGSPPRHLGATYSGFRNKFNIINFRRSTIHYGCLDWIAFEWRMRSHSNCQASPLWVPSKYFITFMLSIYFCTINELICT